MDPQTFEQRPSKTQRKREMTALQALGAELVKLAPEQRARIELPDALRDAIAVLDRIASFEARRRQMQYIGRLMRSVDADAIRAAIGRATGDSKEAVALMHRCERWRDRLLDDDGALTEFLAAYPQADAQRLRSTIRAARRERDAGGPPKHTRALYRGLHEVLSAESAR
ncbi:MAG: ribosome biogenesis factor YjgA [Burkholderiaceae bacterium]